MNQGWNAHCVSVLRALKTLALLGEGSGGEVKEIECGAQLGLVINRALLKGFKQGENI